jgi:hypothetical protein
LGAGNGIDNAGELDQQAIAHEFDDPPSMLGDEGFENLFAQFGQAAKRSGFVRPHKAGIADNIGGKNGSQSAFQAISPSFPRLTIMG